MAKALVIPDFVHAQSITGGVQVGCQILLSGADVPANTPLQFGSFAFLDADTLAQTASKITDMSVNCGAAIGVTVPRASVLMPQYVRGQ